MRPMEQWTARIGRLAFRLTGVRRELVPDFPGEPFLVLQDGTEVRIVRGARAHLLVIDHRTAANRLARVEDWECLDSPEGSADLRLIILADACYEGRAAPPRPRATPALER